MFTSITCILMSSCMVFNIKESNYEAKDLAKDLFIYGFCFMMSVIVVLMVYDLVGWIRSKCKKKKSGKV